MKTFKKIYITEVIDDNGETLIELRGAPARTNCSHQPKTDGWCGTTNNVATYAHGEYPSIEEARSVVKKTFGDTRAVEVDLDDDDVIEAYKLGLYESLGSSESVDYLYDRICNDVSCDTSDEEISSRLYEYETSSNKIGLTIDIPAVRAFMEELRVTRGQE